MTADLFVYAIVAAGLVFWLKTILGTRHGEEHERPNPFTSLPEEGQDSEEGTALLSSEDAITKLSEEPTEFMAVDNKTAENGLLEIARADKDFDIKQFLGGAQDAFVFIVEAFAEGDRDTLKNLLDKPVYEAFDSAITAREKAGETMEKEIHAIKRSNVLEASLDGKTAYVTVRFTAEEITCTRDSEGNVIDGHPEKVAEMIDIWTFGRSVKSKDPKWLVYATRSDDPDDNETIPNTD